MRSHTHLHFFHSLHRSTTSTMSTISTVSGVSGDSGSPFRSGVAVEMVASLSTIQHPAGPAGWPEGRSIALCAAELIEESKL